MEKPELKDFWIFDVLVKKKILSFENLFLCKKIKEFFSEIQKLDDVFFVALLAFFWYKGKVNFIIFFIMNVEDFYNVRKKESQKSFAFFIKRCAHQGNNHGIEICNDFQKVQVVVVGGTTLKGRLLRDNNGLLKKVDDFVFKKCLFKPQDVQVCCAVCSFGKFFDADVSRRLLMLSYQDYPTFEENLEDFSEEAQAEYLMPNYVLEIFNTLFRPRLFDAQGCFLPFNEVYDLFRKLIFVVFCHGAYTMLKLEEKLKSVLEQSSYSAKQRKRLLSNIVVVAYSPDCPLGVSQFEFISLASASDLQTKHANGFVDYVHRGFFVQDCGLCYLPKSKGNVFYCAKYSKFGVEGNALIVRSVDPNVWFEERGKEEPKEENRCLGEHGFLGFEAFPNMSQAALSLQRVGRTILRRAIIFSLQGKTVSLRDLCCESRKDKMHFYSLWLNGKYWSLKQFMWEKKSHRKSFAADIEFVSLD